MVGSLTRSYTPMLHQMFCAQITAPIMYSWSQKPIRGNDFDAEAAARRIALLGSAPPAEIVSSALEYASLNGFTQAEILSLQTLLTAMQTYQPNADANP
jgi:hypothetical protein